MEPADNSISRPMLQFSFFQAVDRWVPRVFEELLWEVYPAFKEHPWRTDVQWRHFWAFDARDPDNLPQLIRWAGGWNVAVSWFFRLTLNTLDTWAMLEPTQPEHFWRHKSGDGGATFAAVSDKDARNAVELPSWDMYWESWETFEPKMDAAYAEYKRQYRERIEELTRASGAKAGEVRRAPEHLDWMVWYQIDGLSREQIAERLAEDRKDLPPEEAAKAPSASAVGKALKDWEALIALPLRKQRTRRRPPGATR
jgi:hypothetical protein